MPSEAERHHAASAPRPRRRRPTFGLVAIVLGVVAIDQSTKSWAVAALDDGPIELLGPGVQFRLVRNTGSAFSLFSGMAPILAVLAMALIVVIVQIGRRETDPWLLAGLALLLGGALGNLFDRVFRDPGGLSGAVVDFIDVGAWPTFNLADTAITLGAGVLLLRGWRSPRERPDDGSEHESRAGP